MEELRWIVSIAPWSIPSLAGGLVVLFTKETWPSVSRVGMSLARSVFVGCFGVAATRWLWPELPITGIGALSFLYGLLAEFIVRYLILIAERFEERPLNVLLRIISWGKNGSAK